MKSRLWGLVQGFVHFALEDLLGLLAENKLL